MSRERTRISFACAVFFHSPVGFCAAASAVPGAYACGATLRSAFPRRIRPSTRAAVRPAAYHVARMRRVFHSRAHFRTARTAQLAHAMCMTQPFGFAQRADIPAQSHFRDLRLIKRLPRRPIFSNRASAHLQSTRPAPTHAKRIRPVFHSRRTFPHLYRRRDLRFIKQPPRRSVFSNRKRFRALAIGTPCAYPC